MIFIPNNSEQLLIEEITKIFNQEYALIQLTSTMLSKSIMDASGLLRKLFEDNGIVDYDSIQQGVEHKVMLQATLLSDKPHEVQVSFYRPITKSGDPRFWIYGLKNSGFAKVGTMLFLTAKDNQLVILPLNSQLDIRAVEAFFGNDTLEQLIDELTVFLTALAKKGFVPSVGEKGKHSPKDVGETFERELAIMPNSSKLPDYKGVIELKAKRATAQSKDTLFSMVPNYDYSPIKGSNHMVQQYGYPATKDKYFGFMDLFVTVSHFPKVNRQGLYLFVDEEKEQVQQWHLDESNGKKTLTCIWTFDELERRLKNKHSNTLWVIAEEKIVDERSYFYFNKAQLSRQPLFASFLILIKQGLITYDWRGRVMTDGTGYKDKGHCWRISPKNRSYLFGELAELEL